LRDAYFFYVAKGRKRPKFSGPSLADFALH
jgi:hypothetical protein